MSDGRPHTTPWLLLLAVVLIASATAAAFSNSFPGQLVFDDEGAICRNPTIRQLWPIWTPLFPPKHGETVTGRPLLNLSFAVNYAVGGLNVWAYHATNLAIHVGAALLLFGLIRRTLLLPTTAERWSAAATPLAAATATLWAVHPLQTESVTYICQRAESLAGFFYLLTLYGLLRGATARRRLPWYTISAFGCLLGVATKETVVSAPLIAALYDRTFLAGSFRTAWQRRWPLYVAMGGALLLLATLVLTSDGRGGTAGIGQEIGCFAYLNTQFGAIVHYLKLCIWPSPLVLDYGAELARTPAEIVPWAIVVGSLLLATVFTLWRWPKPGFLCAFFFVVLAPTSSIVPVTTQTVAEHRMYLPLATVVIGMMLAGWFFCRRVVGLAPKAGVLLMGSAATIAAMILGILTFERNRDYQSGLAMWRDTAAKVPHNARAHNNLGNALSANGQHDDAVFHFQQALQLRPDFAEAHNNLGSSLAALGDPDEAIKHFREALRIRAAYGEAHNNLGSILAAAGHFDEALPHLAAASEIESDSAAPRLNLGAALVRCGRFEDAVGCFRQALDLQPDSAEAQYGLGDALARLGRWHDALVASHTALELALRQDNKRLAEAIKTLISSIESRQATE